MKKLILIVIVMACYTFVFSQNDSTQYQIKDGMQVRKNDSIKYPVSNDTQIRRNDTVKYPVTNGAQGKSNESIDLTKTCVTLHNGKLMIVKNGSLISMEDAMVMQNGTIIMMNGMIKTKEGKVSQINEGDCLDMNGEMVPLMNNKMLNDGPPNK